MAKPNFNYVKRQKELDKKKKNEEKQQRKLERNSPQPDENLEQSPVESPAEGETPE